MEPRHPPLAEADHAYVWNVYHRVSSYPSVAAGVAPDEDEARACVEALLGERVTESAFGVVVKPDGAVHSCHRGQGDGFSWRLLREAQLVPACRAGAARDD